MLRIVLCYFLLASVGCISMPTKRASHENVFQKIAPGMTQWEVRFLAGDPLYRLKNHQEEIWLYHGLRINFAQEKVTHIFSPRSPVVPIAAMSRHSKAYANGAFLFAPDKSLGQVQNLNYEKLEQVFARTFSARGHKIVFDRPEADFVVFLRFYENKKLRNLNWKNKTFKSLHLSQKELAEEPEVDFFTWPESMEFHLPPDKFSDVESLFAGSIDDQPHFHSLILTVVQAGPFFTSGTRNKVFQLKLSARTPFAEMEQAGYWMAASATRYLGKTSKAGFVQSSGDPLLYAAYGVQWFQSRLGSKTWDINDKYLHNETNLEGETPLTAAFRDRNKKIIKRLIESGASINLANDKGQTPLFVAALNQHPAAVKYLLKVKAQINRGDSDGKTPLMAAAEVQDMHTIRYLLKSGARIDQQDHRGRTALMYAAKSQNRSVTRFLLNQGANPLLRTRPKRGEKFGNSAVYFVHPRNKRLRRMLQLAMEYHLSSKNRKKLSKKMRNLAGKKKNRRPRRYPASKDFRFGN